MRLSRGCGVHEVREIQRFMSLSISSGGRSCPPWCRAACTSALRRCLCSWRVSTSLRRAAVLRLDDRPNDLMRLVFLPTPGPGGGGGGGGLQQPKPAPKAMREGTRKISSPVPLRKEPEPIVPAPAPPEPKPEPPLKAEPLPVVVAPIITAPADPRNRVGVLEANDGGCRQSRSRQRRWRRHRDRNRSWRGGRERNRAGVRRRNRRRAVQSWQRHPGATAAARSQSRLHRRRATAKHHGRSRHGNRGPSRWIGWRRPNPQGVRRRVERSRCSGRAPMALRTGDATGHACGRDRRSGRRVQTAVVAMLIITIASILFALVMSVVAWRATQAERARSDARVEALARDIHGPSRGFEELAPSLVDEVPLRLAAVRAEHVPASEMFAVAAHGRSGSRWGLAVAVGAFAVACTAALLIVLSGETPGTPVAVASGAERPTASAAAVAEVPLELTALSHERNAGQLTVQGVVRNPAAGTEMDHLSAVVALVRRRRSRCHHRPCSPRLVGAYSGRRIAICGHYPGFR